MRKQSTFTKICGYALGTLIITTVVAICIAALIAAIRYIF
jgi:hypothetical protein